MHQWWFYVPLLLFVHKLDIQCVPLCSRSKGDPDSSDESDAIAPSRVQGLHLMQIRATPLSALKQRFANNSSEPSNRQSADKGGHPRGFLPAGDFGNGGDTQGSLLALNLETSRPAQHADKDGHAQGSPPLPHEDRSGLVRRPQVSRETLPPHHADKHGHGPAAHNNGDTADIDGLARVKRSTHHAEKYGQAQESLFVQHYDETPPARHAGKHDNVRESVPPPHADTEGHLREFGHARESPLSRHADEEERWFAAQNSREMADKAGHARDLPSAGHADMLKHAREVPLERLSPPMDTASMNASSLRSSQTPELRLRLLAEREYMKFNLDASTSGALIGVIGIVVAVAMLCCLIAFMESVNVELWGPPPHQE